MEKVTGIGGVFFRSNNPDHLARWYEQHLGITRVPESDDQAPWNQQPGPTVFAAFPQDTDYFGREQQQWMVNFRVKNLDNMVAQLRNAGIEVQVDPEQYPNVRSHDPEGNPIELWEPVT